MWTKHLHNIRWVNYKILRFATEPMPDLALMARILWHFRNVGLRCKKSEFNECYKFFFFKRSDVVNRATNATLISLIPENYSPTKYGILWTHKPCNKFVKDHHKGASWKLLLRESKFGLIKGYELEKEKICLIHNLWTHHICFIYGSTRKKMVFLTRTLELLLYLRSNMKKF